MAIIAIDQGTTGTTSILYDEKGAVLARAYREFTQIYPREGWVEHDPEEIWQTVVLGIHELGMKYTGPVEAVGITNQRETTVVWDRRTGIPVYNAIVWQCRRTSEFLRWYEPERELIRARTGLPLDAYFSAAKIRWILGHCARLDYENLLFGTIDTWLIWKLTAGKVHATDFTNASRTMLFNIVDKRWDKDLLDLFDVPEMLLPEVRNSMDGFGTVTALPELHGVPINAVAGDQQAALFGQCCYSPGSIKNTYGTGCFMVMNTGEKLVHSQNGLLSTLAVDVSGKPCYALEGSVFIGGAVLQWLRDELKILHSAEESESMARKVSGNAGVYIVPAFVGLGTPHWRADARGTITGLTRGTNSNHIIRAALESIAYQSYDVFKAMVADTGIIPESLMVDGGASGNSFLMQFQADLLGVPVVKPENIESTSLGVAYLAGLKSGIWTSVDELKTHRHFEHSYIPGMDPESRENLLSGWQRALRQTLAL
ncbi:MAG: glycerol kinase GlpK [Chlorobiaceae bacterium]|jgi:glycerol kinase|nr:glycerol kinase GlpK [Chlorobiaceae bacterium]